MTFQIDSSEVLQHLRNYGITSVDDEALQLFIKDLKKLIKYELRKNSRSSSTETKDTSSGDAHRSMPVRIPSPSGKQHRCLTRDRPNFFPVLCGNYCPNCQKKWVKSNFKFPTDHCEAACCCGKVSTSAFHVENPDCSEKSHVRCKMKDSEKACSSPLGTENKDNMKSCNKLPPKKEEIELNHRPASSMSYVRSQSRNKTRKQARDPVELYHYYQSIWKQHALPGENDHAQLRRSIRERLMKAKSYRKTSRVTGEHEWQQHEKYETQPPGEKNGEK